MQSSMPDSDHNPINLERHHAKAMPMRILLVQSSLYVPSHGGANKSNRLLLESLASRGHDCRAIAAGRGSHGCNTREEFRFQLKERGIPISLTTPEKDTFEVNGVRVSAATNLRTLAASIKAEASEFEPHWLLVSSEDPGQALLSVALGFDASRVIYLGRTTLMLPFGPDSILQNSRNADLIRQTAGVVVVSNYLKEYMQKWGGIDSVHLPLSLNGPGPFPHLEQYDDGYVTMINPCLYKGISIFEALARRFPDFGFAAVPTWGTTDDDVRALRNIGNMAILPPSDDMDTIFRQTRVMVVPSLWAEAKARIITESMLRGIPVLASDVGGNAEALNGIDYLLPVDPIGEYSAKVDGRSLPIARVPGQDISPWCDALQSLLTNREHYETLSRTGRKAALDANEKSTILPFEKYLETRSQQATGEGLGHSIHPVQSRH